MAVAQHNGYDIYATNGVRYVLAKSDDTFAQIGRALHISAGSLRKFNDVTDKKAEPMPGEAIYIERKKTRWEGNEAYHICREGETPYAVAQTYGLRMKSVVKLNKLRKRTTLEAGERIRIK